MRLRKQEKDSIFMRGAKSLKAGRNEIDKGSEQFEENYACLI